MFTGPARWILPRASLDRWPMVSGSTAPRALAKPPASGAPRALAAGGEGMAHGRLPPLCACGAVWTETAFYPI